ncbi:hypothetical protein Tco_1392706 [Tanacetum coccineum]
MADNQPMWGNNRVVAPTPRAAIIADDLEDNFTIKGNHLSMIKDRQFDRRAPADPYKHIAEFIEICEMFRYGNTNADAIKIKIFPPSLAGDAKVWFNELSSGVITTWEEMRKAFSGKTYDPPVNPNAKTTIIHDDSEDEADEAEKEVEPSFPNKLNPSCHHLRVGDDRITFLIDKAMKHSHSNDDTCFRIDIIDEVTEEDLDALLDDSEPFSNTSEKINESSLDKEYENSWLSMSKKILNKNPPTDLEMKHLPKHLKYAFLEKDSLLLVVISSRFQRRWKKMSCFRNLKKHTDCFCLEKHPDIPGIANLPQHKINFEDDVKPVIQRQRQLNPNMKDVVKKEIIKLLDVRIIYLIEDSPWEKCHFKVIEGIVLGQKVCSAGLEVDKEKIDVIATLPPMTNIKTVRSFLGHAGFYHRFIKDFSKISRSVTKLLEKDAVFNFNEECIKAFESLGLLNAIIIKVKD